MRRCMRADARPAIRRYAGVRAWREGCIRPRRARRSCRAFALSFFQEVIMAEDEKKVAPTTEPAIDRAVAIQKIRSALRAGAKPAAKPGGPICPPTCTCGDYNL